MLHRHTDTHLLVYYQDSLLMVKNQSEGYDSYDALGRHTEVFAGITSEKLPSFDPADDHSGQQDPDGHYVIAYGYQDRLLEQINSLLQQVHTAAALTHPRDHLVNTLVKNYTRITYVTGLSPAVAKADTEEAVPLPIGEPPSEMTALGQYFTAHGMWLGALSRLQIQAGSPRTQQLLEAEVLPHFENKKQSAIGNMQIFYMYRLRAKSRELFERTRTGALVIIQDLYRHHDTEQWFHPGVQNTEEYLIHTEHLESYIDPDLEQLREWIKDSYLAHGQPYLVMPLGWVLDEALMHSVALRFLAGTAGAIRLHVETGTGRVILIEVCTDEPAHKVQLSIK